MKHSTKGTFIYKKNKITNKNELRMKGGGHSDANIDFLRKKSIEPEINKEYNNGVRVGNISNHIREKNRTRNGQCWFPKSWDEKDLKKASQHIMNIKRNKKRENGFPIQGKYHKIKIGIYTNKGYITSIFPWYIQYGGCKYDKR